MHYEFKIFPIGSGRRRLEAIREVCECADVKLRQTAEKDGVIIYSVTVSQDHEIDAAFRELLVERQIPVNLVSEYSKL
jgi:uncharacterized protein YkuJ